MTSFPFSDPRVETWLLMSSPLPTTIIFFLYLFVVWYGPRFMKSRPPVPLRNVIIPYNLALVVLSAYMFYEVRKNKGFFFWGWGSRVVGDSIAAGAVGQDLDIFSPVCYVRIDVSSPVIDLIIGSLAPKANIGVIKEL